MPNRPLAVSMGNILNKYECVGGGGGSCTLRSTLNKFKHVFWGRPVQWSPSWTSLNMSWGPVRWGPSWTSLNMGRGWALYREESLGQGPVHGGKLGLGTTFRTDRHDWKIRLHNHYGPDLCHFSTQILEVLVHEGQLVWYCELFRLTNFGFPEKDLWTWSCAILFMNP